MWGVGCGVSVMQLETALSVLILAGGQSTRMGTDKALVCWQGIPLLRRVCTVAQDCCASVAVLTPWPQRYVEIVPEPIQLWQETEPGQGPLVGLNQGLSRITTPWVLLLACDLPCLVPEVLRGWMAQLDAAEPAQLASVPYGAGRWEPLCGFYRRSAQGALKQYIDQGGRSFQGWLAQVPVQAIAVDAAITPMFWNCNTPEDLTHEVSDV